MIFTTPINVKDLSRERFVQIFDRYKKGGLWAVKKAKKREHDKYYLSVPVAFDTESTSIITSDGQKQSWAYIWQLCFDGYVFYGRELYEFTDFINDLVDFVCPDERHYILIYVHNLSFDFQFIRKYFDFTDVFALKSRVPIYARCRCLEFRCSYILTNKPLYRLAEDVENTGLKKLIGELNYKTIRTPETPLSKSELEYCFNDVRLLAAYIEKQIQIEGRITEIPLTSTGYVRRFCRENMTKQEMGFVRNLTLESDEYIALHQAFAGGFTHSNPHNTRVLCEDVSSFDFTSSYPYVMLSETFPMSKGKKIAVSIEHLPSLMKRYHMLIKCCFYGLVSSVSYDYYLSESKALIIHEPLVCNGRVVYANYCEYILTDIDFKVVMQTYDFEHVSFEYAWIYEKDYLPKSLLESVIKFYRDKTQLKDVSGKEQDYMRGKAMLNSIYGMCVTNPLQDAIEYDGEWKTGNKDMSELDTYNSDKKRFIFYPWGVWVTAYARRNLWTGIMEFENDYIYSDTDSIKVMNIEKHNGYIDDYNALTEHKLKKMCAVRGIEYDLLQPRTIQGKLKPLGVWSYEGTYKSFKTLGAKRYMYYSDKYHFTISGLPSKGCDYIASLREPIRAFDDGLHVPATKTGKLVHTYIDEPKQIDVKDCFGKRSVFVCRSSCHLWETDFTLSISADYKAFLSGVYGI